MGQVCSAMQARLDYRGWAHLSRRVHVPVLVIEHFPHTLRPFLGGGDIFPLCQRSV